MVSSISHLPAEIILSTVSRTSTEAGNVMSSATESGTVVSPMTVTCTSRSSAVNVGVMLICGRSARSPPKPARPSQPNADDGTRTDWPLGRVQLVEPQEARIATAATLMAMTRAARSVLQALFVAPIMSVCRYLSSAQCHIICNDIRIGDIGQGVGDGICRFNYKCDTQSPWPETASKHIMGVPAASHRSAVTNLNTACAGALAIPNAYQRTTANRGGRAVRDYGHPPSPICFF